MEETKICKTCHQELSITMFDKKKGGKNGLNTNCKNCVKDYFQQYYKNNKESILEDRKEYAEENKEKIKKYKEEYYQINKESLNEKQKKYNEENKEVIAERNRRYYIKNKDYFKTYRQENKEIIKIKYLIYYKNNFKDYYNKNKESFSRRRKKYYDSHKEQDYYYHKQYRLKNRDKVLSWLNNYKAKKKELPHTFTPKQWEHVKNYFNYRCAYCGEELPLEQEHFIALSKGGGYTEDNIICACRSCNSSKGNKVFEEWYPKYIYYSKEREEFIINYIKSIKYNSLLTSAI